MSRERDGLLAVAALIEQVEADVDSLALALAAVKGEVHDALYPPEPVRIQRVGLRLSPTLPPPFPPGHPLSRGQR